MVSLLGIDHMGRKGDRFIYQYNVVWAWDDREKICPLFFKI